MRLLPLCLPLALLAAPAGAQHVPGSHQGHGPGGALSHGEAHQMHKDTDAYIAAMEAGDRDAWQRPDALLAALGVRRGQRVAEIGPGPGYFTRRLGRLVGDSGWVYAVDVEPKMLQALHERLRKDGLRNVSTVLAPADDPLLPDGAVDLVLIVDTYHHLTDRPRYLRRLARALRPGGRVAIVDFHKRPLPVGPPPEMKLTPAEVIAEAAQGGLAALPGPPGDLLPHQYVLLFSPSPRRAPGP